MADVRKLPYYQIESSSLPFTRPKWVPYMGAQGCVPIATQKAVSMDRLAPGEAPPRPKPPESRPTPELEKARNAAEALRKHRSESAKKPETTSAKQAPEPEAEECEAPPVFDMLDIPDAMESMKWPVSAKIARKWFNGQRHVYNDDPNSIQPIDDTTVNLDWALKFGNVKEKYNELLTEKIYSEKAVDVAKHIVRNRLHETFVGQNSASLSFDTTPFTRDLRQFHIDWQFQRTDITNWDTMEGAAPNDLTGTLANFAIYVAIGSVVVYGDKYFNYGKGTKAYCVAPNVEVSHVYVYIKDNYSFIDKGADSQYLGHWNKTGVILTTGGVIRELINGKFIHSDLGNAPRVTMGEAHNRGYLVKNGLDKPVDTRRGLIKKFREPDVYYPILNRHYNEWRDKHNRGGDFMIYSKPKLVKLRNPIKFTLEALCRQPEAM